MQADLLDVLTRLASASNIRCMRVTPPFDGLDQFDYGLRKALDPILTGRNSATCCCKAPRPTRCCLPKAPLNCSLRCSAFQTKKTLCS